MSQHKGNAPHRPGGPGPMMHHKKEKLKDPKGTIKRLLRYLGSSKFIMIFVFLITLLTTLITIIGTKLNGDTVDKFIITGDLNGLAKICLVMLILYITSSVCVFIQNRAMVRIAQATTLSIRKDLFINMQGLPLRYYDSHSSGDLMSRLTNDVDNINMTLAQSVTQLFSGVISIIGMLMAMLLLSPVLTLIGLLTTPFMFILMRAVIKRTQPYFIKQQAELGKLNGYIEEMVSGQKSVLLFSQEENVKEEFRKINSNLTHTAILAQTFSGFMGPMNNCINNFTYLIVAVSGGYLMIQGFDITVGIIFSFILYMRNFTRPVNEIFNLFNTIQSALAGAERVFEVMDEEKEQDVEGAVDMNDIEGEVILQDVHFSYVPEKPILKHATLTANKGQTIAIVGPTGAGKTTIINLLTKFYDIDSGLITIDGHNIEEVTRESLRKSIAMVLQDTYLFSVSVRENIRYGNLDATDEEVEQAAKLANAHSFIKQLPDGYDTILSDNGSNLSQGQRQLLAIARAILMKSSILILDEATSSIDTRTEVAIQKAMERLMEGKTTFVIAHRLSTIRNADQILALKDGQIIERGTHYELLEKDGFYANLYNSQFKKGIDLDNIIA